VFGHREPVRPVPIDLVGAREAERRFRAKIASRDQDIQGSHRVDVEIIIGNFGRQVVGRLGRRMNDEIRAMLADDVSDQLPITDVGMKMMVVAKLVRQAGNYRRG
jgi:hypothetical protein